MLSGEENPCEVARQVVPVDSRAELEVEKLRLEIEAAKRRRYDWWWSGSLPSLLTPVMAGIAAIAVWYTGIIDVKREQSINRQILSEIEMKKSEEMVKASSAELAAIKEQLNLAQNELRPFIAHRDAMKRLADLEYPRLHVKTLKTFNSFLIAIGPDRPDLSMGGHGAEDNDYRRRDRDRPSQRTEAAIGLLPSISGLRAVQIEDVELSVQHISQLSGIQSMEMLIIRNCGLPAGFPSALKSAKGLKCLYLSGCDLSVPDWRGVAELELLAIYYCKFSDVKSPLETLPTSIRHLHVIGSRLSDDCIAVIEDLAPLLSLELKDVELPDERLVAVGQKHRGKDGDSSNWHPRFVYEPEHLLNIYDNYRESQQPQQER